MLLELNQGVGAAELAYVQRALRDLFEAIAEADSPDVGELLQHAWALDNTRLNPEQILPILELIPDDRKRLREAVVADLAYSDHLDNPHFRFRYRDLDETIRIAADPLLLSMYRSVLYGRYGFAVGGAIGTLTRSSLMRAFREANPGLAVCPACLVQSLEWEPSDSAELDHYLPRSAYPPLAAHPTNLAPLCHRCNGFMIKSNKDPLDLGDGRFADLTAVWLPYHRPGLKELRIEFVLDAKSIETVRCRGVSTVPQAPQRAAAFDRVFDLSRRWSGRIQQWHESLVRSLRETKRLSRADEVRAELERMITDRYGMFEVSSSAYLEATYMRWLIDDGNAFELLMGPLSAIPARNLE